MKEHVQESLIARAFKYCTSSKTFLLLILIILFIAFYLQDFPAITYTEYAIEIMMRVLIIGYSLQITNDIIHHGKRLPKIRPKKLLIYGIKGFIVLYVYLFIQLFILGFIAVNLNFPTFELEEALISLPETINLFFTHNPMHTTIFIIFSVIVIYISVFFMEMALAQIADDGKLLNSFNLIFLKEIIDRIGWRTYIFDYTLVIISISLLLFINMLVFDIPIVNFIVITFLGLMIIVIEFGSIGLIYRENLK